MKKILMVILASLLAISGLAFARGDQEARKVLVVIWDGAEWDNIEALYSSGLLPTLASVGPLHHLTTNTDCFGSGESVQCMQTETKTQHATMLTGCLADVHGTFNNSIFQLVPDGLTVYEQIEALDASIKTAHLVSKNRQIGAVLFGNIKGDVDAFYASQAVTKYAANVAIRLLYKWRDRDFFIVVHFKMPDNIGHNAGNHSSKYRQAIIANDFQLGKMLQVLESDGSRPETRIYVLADHGFGCPDAYDHECSPNAFIASNDPAVTDLMMEDVAGILLANFGLQPPDCGQ